MVNQSDVLSSQSIEEAVYLLNNKLGEDEKLNIGIDALKHAGMQNELAALIALINRDFENALRFAPEFVSGSELFIDVLNNLDKESNLSNEIEKALGAIDRKVIPSVLSYALEKIIIKATPKKSVTGKFIESTKEKELRNIAKRARELLNNDEIDNIINTIISYDSLSLKSSTILTITKSMGNIVEWLEELSQQDEDIKNLVQDISNNEDLSKILVISSFINNSDYSLTESQYQELIDQAEQQNPYAACCDIILRVGNPPNYNQPGHGTKTGLNLSKTSNQKLFTGYILKDPVFTRIGPDGYPIGHDEKDAKHLALPITDHEYQHTIPLKISMQQIVKDLKTSNGKPGDLTVEAYQDGYLIVRYIQGESFHGYDGQIILDLKARNTKRDEILYSRTWDRFEMDELKSNQPEVLSMVPPEVYEEAFSYVIPLYTTKPQQHNSVDHLALEPIHAFANVVQNVEELKDEIKRQVEAKTISSQIMQKIGEAPVRVTRKNVLNFFLARSSRFFRSSPEMQNLKTNFDNERVAIKQNTDLSESEKKQQLSILKEKFENDKANLEKEFQHVLDKELETVLNAGAKIVVGDHDTLARGCPHVLFTEQLQEFTVIRNTFAPGDSISKLTAAMYDYFDILKYCSIPGSTLYNLLRSIDTVKDIMPEFALNRAGCINAHQFMQNQLINYAFKAQEEAFYAEKKYKEGLQYALDAALNEFNFDKSRNEEIVARAQELYQPFKKALPKIVQSELDSHLARHVQHALQISDRQNDYKIPHPQKDFYIDEYFRHGDEAENPYGCNYAGAWLLMSSGRWISGKTQESLAELMYISDLLERSYIDNNYGADMNAGWGLVIERQLQLHQPVKSKTHLNYLSWKVEKRLENNEPVSINELLSYNKWKMIQIKKSKNKQMPMTSGWARVIEKIIEHREEIDHSIYSLYIDWQKANFAQSQIQEEKDELEEKYNEDHIDERTHLLAGVSRQRYVESDSQLFSTEETQNYETGAVNDDSNLWNTLLDDVEGVVKVVEQVNSDNHVEKETAIPRKGDRRRSSRDVSDKSTTMHTRYPSYYNIQKILEEEANANKPSKRKSSPRRGQEAALSSIQEEKQQLIEEDESTITRENTPKNTF